MIKKHLDKENLHHSYLIEGNREEIFPEVLSFIESLGIKVNNNPDVIHICLDSFKMIDAINLKSFAFEKGFFQDKKIFIISANSFLLDAQNSLLKIFEEPIENTHFFVITPDTNSLLKTFISRFYFIKAAPTPVGIGAPTESVGEKFLAMPLQRRIEFLKELLPKKDEEDEEDKENKEDVKTESNNSKALKLLNSLEEIIYQNLVSKTVFDIEPKIFEHMFKVREVLRIPGSSARTLMESVALMVPDFKN